MNLYAQKQAYIPQTVSGEMSWCQGYSEPGSGSDLASLTTSGLKLNQGELDPPVGNSLIMLVIYTVDTYEVESPKFPKDGS